MINTHQLHDVLLLAQNNAQNDVIKITTASYDGGFYIKVQKVMI